MTEPLSIDREAELRRLASGEDWSPAQHEDLAVLFGEIDQLRERVADLEDELAFVAARANEH